MASRKTKATRKKTAKRKPGLTTLRKRIDTIDHELVSLMNQRADVARDDSVHQISLSAGRKSSQPGGELELLLLAES